MLLLKENECIGYKLKKNKMRQVYYQTCIFENISFLNEDVIYFIQNLEVHNRILVLSSYGCELFPSIHRCIKMYVF
jgi:hypothetical protein